MKPRGTMYGVRVCRLCGQPGHYAKTCPNVKEMAQPAGLPVSSSVNSLCPELLRPNGAPYMYKRCCNICGKPGHYAKTCPRLNNKRCSTIRGKPGHYAKTCPQLGKKPRAGLEAPYESVEEASMRLEHTRSEKKHKVIDRVLYDTIFRWDFGEGPILGSVPSEQGASPALKTPSKAPILTEGDRARPLSASALRAQWAEEAAGSGMKKKKKKEQEKKARAASERERLLNSSRGHGVPGGADDFPIPAPAATQAEEAAGSGMKKKKKKKEQEKKARAASERERLLNSSRGHGVPGGADEKATPPRCNGSPPPAPETPASPAPHPHVAAGGQLYFCKACRFQVSVRGNKYSKRPTFVCHFCPAKNFEVRRSNNAYLSPNGDEEANVFDVVAKVNPGKRAWSQEFIQARERFKHAIELGLVPKDSSRQGWGPGALLADSVNEGLSDLTTKGRGLTPTRNQAPLPGDASFEALPPGSVSEGGGAHFRRGPVPRPVNREAPPTKAPKRPRSNGDGSAKPGSKRPRRKSAPLARFGGETAGAGARGGGFPAEACALDLLASATELFAQEAGLT